MNYTYQLTVIANHGTAEKLAVDTRKAGARGGTILHGRGSAQMAILRFLALSDVEKDILITLVRENEIEALWTTVTESRLFGKKNRGIAYILRIGGMMNPEKETRNHELITVIADKGYADDIMDAARKAGARGGTIVHARGTGKSEDEKFFGVTIVPEKEQILILSESESAQAIRDAINALPCLMRPGMGIMYSTKVERFTQLGS